MIPFVFCVSLKKLLPEPDIVKKSLPFSFVLRSGAQAGCGGRSKSAGNLRACTNLGLFFTRLRPPRRLRLSASASAFAAATNCNLLQIRGQLGDRKRRKTISSPLCLGPAAAAAAAGSRRPPRRRFSRIVEYFVGGRTISLARYKCKRLPLNLSRLGNPE